jgi:hypothetical protein
MRWQPRKSYHANQFVFPGAEEARLPRATILPKRLFLAGEGNRTLVSSLEGYSFTIKLHPRARNVTRLAGSASAFWLRSVLEKISPAQ